MLTLRNVLVGTSLFILFVAILLVGPELQGQYLTQDVPPKELLR